MNLACYFHFFETKLDTCIFFFVMFLQEADKPESHITSTKLYVSGVKDGLDESDLSEYFSQFGNVQHVDIIVDRETRQRRGFAFVTFDDYDAVDKIVCKFLHVPTLQLTLFF